MEFLEQISELISLIKHKKIAVIYGAGLSCNSGVFKSKDFYLQILKNLKGKDDLSLFDESMIYNEENNYNTIYSRVAQFEDFLMRLYDDTNIELHRKEKIFEHLYNVFKVGEPNKNHYFLAYLMYHGYIDTICTTNFDRLFEDAYFSLYDKNIPLITYILSGQENNLPITKEVEIDKKFYNGKHDNINITKRYIKLHGCINNTNISTFLPLVASKSNVDCIRNVLCTKVLNKYENILVLGYSFSDAYDIGKVLRENNINKPRLFIVSHEKPTQKDKIPYTLYEEIVANTDDVISTLWAGIADDKFCKPKEIYKINTFEQSEQHIKDFMKRLNDENQGYYSYLHAWRYHYELGQNLFLTQKQFKEEIDIDKKNALELRLRIFRKALQKSLRYANISRSRCALEHDLNAKLAEKHLFLSQIAANYDKPLCFLIKLKILANDSKDLNKWIWSEIMFWYFLWKYELSTYGYIDDTIEFNKNFIKEIYSVLINISDNEKWLVLFVKKRIIVIEAMLLTKLDCNKYSQEIENKLSSSKEFLQTYGRIEYMPLIYHAFAKYYKYRIPNDLYMSYKYYEKAIALYKNLGDIERMEICCNERDKLINKS